MIMEPTSPTPLDAVKGSLAERRAKIVENKILILEVPDYDDPPVKVHFRPVEHAVIKAAIEKSEKGPKDQRAEAELRANADLLVKACVEITSGGQSWTGFGDADLAT